MQNEQPKALGQWPHGREEDDIPDRRGIGQDHHQSIDPDPQPSCRWHPIFQGLDIILIHNMCLFIAAGTLLQLLLKPSPLVDRVIEL